MGVCQEGTLGVLAGVEDKSGVFVKVQSGVPVCVRACVRAVPSVSLQICFNEESVRKGELGKYVPRLRSCSYYNAALSLEQSWDRSNSLSGGPSGWAAAWLHVTTPTWALNCTFSTGFFGVAQQTHSLYLLDRSFFGQHSKH